MRASDVQDLYELAPLQQGILFHCLAAQDPGLYLITMSYGLEGPLDVAEPHAAAGVVEGHDRLGIRPAARTCQRHER